MTLLTSLKAMADEKRLKILHMLIANDLCVGALAKQLDISKPALSQHLQILRKAGLVKGEKRGYWTHYVVDRQALWRIALELNNLALEEKSHKTMCWRINENFESKSKPVEVDMCQNCCQQPDKLMDKPENCTSEQIGQCHGESFEHACTKGKCTSEND
ncbi:MAG: ArsR family transcriptional regulator [Desulfobacteraceae bacterium]|nr:MAG: ArsR family transcriptional regulator [Desulfobacteraceae bacterium]